MKAKAFSLLELLVALAIIALLAGMVVGTAKYAHQKTLASATVGQLHQIALALELYKSDNGYYPVTPYDWPMALMIVGTVTNRVQIPVCDAGVYGTPGTITWATSNHWALAESITGRRRDDLTFGAGFRPCYYQEMKRPQVAAASGLWYLVDPYGDPWEYLNLRGSTNQFNGRTFDLCSFGAIPQVGFVNQDAINGVFPNWGRR